MTDDLRPPAHPAAAPARARRMRRAPAAARCDPAPARMMPSRRPTSLRRDRAAADRRAARRDRGARTARSRRPVRPARRAAGAAHPARPAGAAAAARRRLRRRPRPADRHSSRAPCRGAAHAAHGRDASRRRAGGARARPPLGAHAHRRAVRAGGLRGAADRRAAAVSALRQRPGRRCERHDPGRRERRRDRRPARLRRRRRLKLAVCDPRRARRQAQRPALGSAHAAQGHDLRRRDRGPQQEDRRQRRGDRRRHDPRGSLAQRDRAARQGQGHRGRLPRGVQALPRPTEPFPLRRAQRHSHRPRASSSRRPTS